VCVCVCVSVTIDFFANVSGTAHSINLKFCSRIAKAIAQVNP